MKNRTKIISMILLFFAFSRPGTCESPSAYQTEINHEAPAYLNHDFSSVLRKDLTTNSGGVACISNSFCKELISENILGAIEGHHLILVEPNTLPDSGQELLSYLEQNSHCTNLATLNIDRFPGENQPEPVPARPSAGLAVWDITVDGRRLIIIRAENYLDDFTDQTPAELDGPTLPPPVVEQDSQIIFPNAPNKVVNFQSWASSLSGAYEIPRMGLRGFVIIVNPQSCRVIGRLMLGNNFDTDAHGSDSSGSNVLVLIGGRYYFMGAARENRSLYELSLYSIPNARDFAYIGLPGG